MKWAPLTAYLALIAAALVVIPAVAPKEYREVLPDASGQPLGYATWSCSDREPFAWIRIDVLLGDDNADLVVIHEHDHLMLMRQYSCTEWASRAKSLEFHKLVEARAFCAMAKASVSLGRRPSLTNAVDHYAKWLYGGYWFVRSYDDAHDAIMLFCGANPERGESLVRPKGNG